MPQGFIIGMVISTIIGVLAGGLITVFIYKKYFKTVSQNLEIHTQVLKNQINQFDIIINMLQKIEELITSRTFSK